MTARPCAGCGVVVDAGAWCAACAPPARGSRTDGRTATERGYDAAWVRLSARARRLTPWCADCGAREDLTSDHLPGAWEKRARGERLGLGDVEVVCRPCNSRRGSRRVKGVGGDPRLGDAQPAGGARRSVTPPDFSRSVL